jgi:spore coat polysaccharide biosynthesis protein SpsF (cytidylyltransferase family)
VTKMALDQYLKKKNKISAIIQARLDSKRLPGKVLLKIRNKTILEHVILRLKKSKKIDEIIVATSNHSSDIKIANFCKKKKIKYFCGSKNNLINRYLGASKKYNCKNIVRITADCPLIDPGVIDEIIQIYENSCYEMVSLAGNFPDGLDATIISFKTLQKIKKLAKKNYEKEHILETVYNNKKYFKFLDYEKFSNLEKLRITLDEPKDFELINKIFLKMKKFFFTIEEILVLYSREKKLFRINNKIIRNEGLKLSKKNN